MLQRINQRWAEFCIVTATGPSLTPDVAEACRGFNIVAVSDAYRMLPFADALYSSDARWWNHHHGCPDFAGEKWSSHGNERDNNKIPTAQKYGLHLVRGAADEGFSLDPSRIHYLNNSGCQAIGLAIHFLGQRGRIALVGFDMRVVEGKRHFFGNHPPEMHRETNYRGWFAMIERAAKMLPPQIEIINCTPGSALTCFRMAPLADVLPPARGCHDSSFAA